jgi:hypothetical protein
MQFGQYLRPHSSQIKGSVLVDDDSEKTEQKGHKKAVRRGSIYNLLLVRLPTIPLDSSTKLHPRLPHASARLLPVRRSPKWPVSLPRFLCILKWHSVLGPNRLTYGCAFLASDNLPGPPVSEVGSQTRACSCDRSHARPSDSQRELARCDRQIIPDPIEPCSPAGRWLFGKRLH